MKTYQIITSTSSDDVGMFIKTCPSFSEIVGYSALGHIFLYSPNTYEYIVFYPFRQSGKAYGIFYSIEDFEKQVLQEYGFDMFVLQPDFVEELIKVHGELADNEVFIPEPYFEHDCEDVNKFGKGDVFVMLELTNQFINGD